MMANILMLPGVVTKGTHILGSWVWLVRKYFLEALSLLFRLTTCDSLICLSLTLPRIILLNLRKLGGTQLGMGNQALRTELENKKGDGGSLVSFSTSWLPRAGAPEEAVPLRCLHCKLRREGSIVA